MGVIDSVLGEYLIDNDHISSNIPRIRNNLDAVITAHLQGLPESLSTSLMVRRIEIRQQLIRAGQDLGSLNVKSGASRIRGFSMTDLVLAVPVSCGLFYYAVTRFVRKSFWRIISNVRANFEVGG